MTLTLWLQIANLTKLKHSIESQDKNPSKQVYLEHATFYALPLALAIHFLLIIMIICEEIDM